MAETQRPIISGATDAERAVSQARYKAREAAARRAMSEPAADTAKTEGTKAKPQKRPPH
jgi:hypothetical protein